MQALWITDLLVRNREPGVPLDLEFRWFPDRQTGAKALTRRGQVPPARTLLLTDVVANLFGSSGRGTLRMNGSAPFSVLWRTHDARLPHTMTDPRFLRALGAGQAVRDGTFALSFRPGAEGTRSNVGFFNPGDEPCEVRLVISERGGGTPMVVQTVRLPPSSYELRDADKLLGVPRSRTITADLTLRFLANRPVLAFASIIEDASNRSTYVFAGEPANPISAPSAH
jgi:hypothetical protein